MYSLFNRIYCFAISLFFSFNLTVLQAISPCSEDYGFGVCIPKYVSAPNLWEGEASKLVLLIRNEPSDRREKLQHHATDTQYLQRKQQMYDELVAFLEGIKDPYAPGQEPFKIQYNEKQKEQERGKINQTKTVKLKPLEAIEEPLTDKVAKDEKELHRFFRIFREEAFETSKDKSCTLWDQSAIMMVLLNRYKSISSTLNKTLKRYTPRSVSHPTLLVERVFWEPKWVTTRGQEVPLKEVHLYFLNYLDTNPEAALAFLKKQEFDVLKKHLNAFVPYRDLREVIRISAQRIQCMKNLFGSRPYVYEAIHDGDIMGLRGTDGIGLYSHYMRLIADNQTRLPDILSTGYQAYYDPQQFRKAGYTEAEYYHIMRAIEEDRYGREALAKVNFNLIYISEPNFLARVISPDTLGMMPYSFMGGLSLGSHNKYPEGPAESGMVLAALKADTPRYIGIFDASHPILMRLPDRMLRLKKSKTSFKDIVSSSPFSPEKDTFSCDAIMVTKLTENIAQTVFSFRDLATTVYRQLEFKGKKYTYGGNEIKRANGLLTSLLTQLFNAYDPIEMMEKSSRLQDVLTSTEKVELQQKKVFLFILAHYESLSSQFKFLFNPDKEAGNDNVKETISRINSLRTKVGQTAALRLLIDEIFHQGTFDILHDGAKALGKMRVKLLHRYFVTPSFQQNSPHKVKELSEKKGEEENFAKEERRQVAQKLVFGQEEESGAEPSTQQPTLSIVVKEETNVPTEIEQEVRLKPFSSRDVMDYLERHIMPNILLLLAGYKEVNIGQNGTKLRTSTNARVKKKWETLLRNLESQYPLVARGLKSEFSLPH